MTDRIVTTSEVGSWMQDLGNHFSEIIEDRSGKRVRPPAVDENGVKWTYERIEDVTGIPERTARRMVQKSRSGSPAAGPDYPERAQSRARALARNEPKAVVAGIMDAPEEVQDEIFHELKLRRAGVDTSPATRKAAEAAGNEYAGAIRQSIATTHIELCIQALNDAAEQLAEAIAEDVVTPDGLERIDQAHDRYVTTRHEAEFKVESSERR
jgi:hypothetical protein